MKHPDNIGTTREKSNQGIEVDYEQPIIFENKKILHLELAFAGETFLFDCHTFRQVSWFINIIALGNSDIVGK